MTLYRYLLNKGYVFSEADVSEKNEVLTLQKMPIPFDTEKLFESIKDYLSDHFELVTAGNDALVEGNSLVFDFTQSIKVKDEMFFVGFLIVSIVNQNGQSSCTIRLVYHYGRDIVSREMLTPIGV